MSKSERTKCSPLCRSNHTPNHPPQLPIAFICVVFYGNLFCFCFFWSKLNNPSPIPKHLLVMILLNGIIIAREVVFNLSYSIRIDAPNRQLLLKYCIIIPYSFSYVRQFIAEGKLTQTHSHTYKYKHKQTNKTNTHTQTHLRQFMPSNADKL